MANWLDPFGIFSSGSDYRHATREGQKSLTQGQQAIERYMSPYQQAGLGQLPNLQNQYGQLTGDPGGFVNRVGQGYQKSPGFDWAMKQAMQGQAHAAAAGGMAGSPQHELESGEMATNLANQDYMNWLKTVLGQYDIGLTGQQGLYNTGFEAGRGMGEDIASILGKKGELSYQSGLGQRQQQNQMLQSLLMAGMFL